MTSLIPPHQARFRERLLTEDDLAKARADYLRRYPSEAEWVDSVIEVEQDAREAIAEG